MQRPEIAQGSHDGGVARGEQAAFPPALALAFHPKEGGEEEEAVVGEHARVHLLPFLLQLLHCPPLLLGFEQGPVLPPSLPAWQHPSFQPKGNGEEGVQAGGGEEEGAEVLGFRGLEDGEEEVEDGGGGELAGFEEEGDDLKEGREGGREGGRV